MTTPNVKAALEAAKAAFNRWQGDNEFCCHDAAAGFACGHKHAADVLAVQEAERHVDAALASLASLAAPEVERVRVLEDAIRRHRKARHKDYSDYYIETAHPKDWALYSVLATPPPVGKDAAPGGALKLACRKCGHGHADRDGTKGCWACPCGHPVNCACGGCSARAAAPAPSKPSGPAAIGVGLAAHPESKPSDAPTQEARTYTQAEWDAERQWLQQQHVQRTQERLDAKDAALAAARAELDRVREAMVSHDCERGPHMVAARQEIATLRAKLAEAERDSETRRQKWNEETQRADAAEARAKEAVSIFRALLSGTQITRDTRMHRIIEAFLASGREGGGEVKRGA